MVVPGGYLEVLEPDSRRLPVAQTETEMPKRYEDYDWRTREALELLVLVHSVNNQAWAKLLLEECALRFENEEGYFDDNDDGPPINDSEAFTLECKREREVPLSPRFQFRVQIGRQHTGKLSPIAKWKNFFLSHTSNYQPSPEFLEAKRRILATQDEDFKKHHRVPQSLEIPVSLDVSMPRDANKKYVAHLKELREMMDDMKSYCSRQVGKVECIGDCAHTVTYRLDSLSLDICGVDMNAQCVESVLRVLGAGIPIGALNVDLYCWPGEAYKSRNRETLAKFLTGPLVEPLGASLKVRSIDSLRFTGGHSWHCDALCSTLPVARTPVAHLEIRGNVTDQLLAEALFYSRTTSRSVYPSFRGLDISYYSLYEKALERYVKAVKTKEARCGMAQSSISWQLRQGTLLHFPYADAHEGAIVTENAIVLPVSTNRNLSSTNSWDRHSEKVKVVLPGYGECEVSGGAVVAGGVEAKKQVAEPLSSLSLNVLTGAKLLQKLLDQIGWAFETLRLQYAFDTEDVEMMAAILRACPKLKNLSIESYEVNLDHITTFYEQFDGDTSPAISSLTLVRVGDIGSGRGISFASLLGDSTSRLARHLLEFSIISAEESTAVDDSTLRALWTALKNNTKLKKLVLTVQPRVLRPWKSRFRQFHGQVLPTDSLDLPSKLAFLSATCSGINTGEADLPARQKLDQDAVSLVFKFAATRVIRSVTMFYRI